MCGVNEKALPWELKDNISFFEKFKLVSSGELINNKGDEDALYSIMEKTKLFQAPAE